MNNASAGEYVLSVLALLAVSGCDNVAPRLERHFRCINGTLHKQWDATTWVQEDGHDYIGHTDGPMKCAEAE